MAEMLVEIMKLYESQYGLRESGFGESGVQGIFKKLMEIYTIKYYSRVSKDFPPKGISFNSDFIKLFKVPHSETEAIL